jgi:thiol:disulfide interchange protein
MFKKTSMQFYLIVALLLAILMLGSCAKETAGVKSDLEWFTSFDEALEAAQDKSKPVMIDFYADWCGWCKRLDSDTYAHESVVSKAKDFIALKIDADVERELSTRYRIAGLPTILFIDHTGKEIHRVVGYRDAAKFIVEMDTALRAYKG